MAACLLSAPVALGAQYLQGGDFEGGTEIPALPGFEGSIDHPAWQEEDDLFASPICSTKCGTAGAGPRSGSHWAWFGAGTKAEQNQNLLQDVAFPSGPATVALSFYVWVGEFGNESAVLKAKVDGESLFILDATNQADFEGGYRRVVVPLEDPLQGDSYGISFEYDSEAGVGEERTSISVDDISVETTYLRDGDFEAAIAPNPFEPTYYDSPGWVETANDGYKSPICEVTACGSPGPGDIREPRSGAQWFYFGFPTNASVSQLTNTPALTEATLSFQVITAEFVNPGARLTFKVDGATRFTIDPSNDQAFADRYRQVTVSLGPLAAGNHGVEIAYTLPSSPGGRAAANVDDVALTGTIAPPPATPAPISSTPPVSTPSPQTRITKLKLLTTKSKKGTPKLGAKLSFAGSGGSGKLRFQCKLDQGKFKPCTSPKTYRSLTAGNHSFQVRAVDATGAADATPAKRNFQIASPKPRGSR